ncbi:MAG: CehA/McbA family metallohydrolase [Acidobacteriota bacterium]
MRPGMKHFIFPIILILFCFQGHSFSVKTADSLEENLGKISRLQKEEDYFFSGKEPALLIGASLRKFLSYTNYPLTAAKGSILAFLPLGLKATSELTAGAPVLEFGEKKIFLQYNEINLPESEDQKDKLTIRLKAFYSDKKGRRAICETTYEYFLNLNQVNISSTVRNTGEKDWEEFKYSLYFNAQQSYRFSPYNENKSPELKFTVFPKNSHYIAWLEHTPQPQSGNSQENILPRGQARKVGYSLFVEKDPEKILASIYKKLNISFQTLDLNFECRPDLPLELLIEDPVTSNLFFRSFLEGDKIRIPLPQGVYKVRTHFFPAITETLFKVGKKEENKLVLAAPSLGKIKLKIQNSRGKYIPGKVSISGISPTKTPYFRPINPRKSGRYWEQFKNSCFPPAEGLQIELPAGVYLMTASRGPEYSLDKKILEVFNNHDYEITFTIDEVLNTDNLTSLDPHLHTIYSDGTISVKERIKSIVAEGIDVAVSSDHNIIIDYSPALNNLSLGSQLVVITGNEITHGGVIHFNAYPLQVNLEEELNGAIDPTAEEAGLLFEASRTKTPGAIIQVNHPRSGNIGYFNTYCLEPEKASSAKKNFDPSFQLMEVMNGPMLYESNAQTIEDWFHLLNKGYRIFAVGSSDSHTIDKGEPGYSRTYVYFKSKAGKAFDIEAFIEALKNGRTFVTNGPLVDFKVNSKSGPGDFLSDKDGNIKLSIKVQTAPWISVNEARIILNGERLKTIPISFKPGHRHWIHKQTLTLKKDSWIVIEILGERSLFPVVQRTSYNGTPERSVLPYAITNPVFIDTDGNGLFDAPWPEEIEETHENSK